MSADKSSMSLLPLHYDGHCVRTYVDETGISWWVAQDIGDVLGIVEARSTLRHHPDNEKGVHGMPTAGGVQQILMVNEPGLYRLIFQSRRPEAETFKRWVFHDVLPSIRRTGAYNLVESNEHQTACCISSNSLTPG